MRRDYQWFLLLSSALTSANKNTDKCGLECNEYFVPSEDVVSKRFGRGTTQGLNTANVHPHQSGTISRSLVFKHVAWKFKWSGITCCENQQKDFLWCNFTQMAPKLVQWTVWQSGGVVNACETFHRHDSDWIPGSWAEKGFREVWCSTRLRYVLIAHQ